MYFLPGSQVYDVQRRLGIYGGSRWYLVDCFSPLRWKYEVSESLSFEEYVDIVTQLELLSDIWIFQKIFYLSSFLFKGDVLGSTGLLVGSSEDPSINCFPISGKKSINTPVFTFWAFQAFPCLLFTKKVFFMTDFSKTLPQSHVNEAPL